MKKILMISMRNTCRAAIAEAVMEKVIKKEGLQNEWQVFNAFTIGSQALNAIDRRVINVLEQHGIDYVWQGRKVLPHDFGTFDYIFCMDDSVKKEIIALAPKNLKTPILMLGDFGLSRWDRCISDPFYLVGDEGFEIVYQKCCVACDAFLKYALIGNV